MSDTATNGNQKTTKPVPTFDFNAPVEATGVDIPPGSYPGCLRSFGEPMWLKSNFGAGEEKLRLEVEFAVRVKDGSVQTVNGLISPPHQGSKGLEVNRKSNLFKLIRAAMPDAVNSEGQFAKGFKLADVIGKPLLVEIGKNAKEFAQYKSASPAVDGLKYPTEEELKALASEEVPF